MAALSSLGFGIFSHTLVRALILRLSMTTTSGGPSRTRVLMNVLFGIWSSAVFIAVFFFFFVSKMAAAKHHFQNGRFGLQIFSVIYLLESNHHYCISKSKTFPPPIFIGSTGNFSRLPSHR
jgi:hypothetical protein